MGNASTLDRRVAVLEHRMNDHDVLYARLDGKVDRLADDMTDVKSKVNVLTGKVNVLTGKVDVLTDQMGVLTGKVDGLSGKVDGLTGQVGVLTDDVSGLKAGQIEVRDMVARLLATAENDKPGG